MVHQRSLTCTWTGVDPASQWCPTTSHSGSSTRTPKQDSASGLAPSHASQMISRRNSSLISNQGMLSIMLVQSKKRSKEPSMLIFKTLLLNSSHRNQMTDFCNVQFKLLVFSSCLIFQSLIRKYLSTLYRGRQKWNAILLELNTHFISHLNLKF